MMRAISRADFVSNPWEASFWLSVVRFCNKDAGSILFSSFVWAPAPSCAVALVSIEYVPTVYCICKSDKSGQNSGDVKCHSIICSNIKLKDFSHSIMKCGADLSNELALAIRPCAIGQEHNCNCGIQIDPEGASAVSQMANGVAGKASAR